MFWVELALFLACILIGARIGGIGLRTIAGLGLMISPPVDDAGNSVRE